MRAHSSLRLGTLHGTTPELLASPWYCAWGFCMVWEAGSPTRRPLLPLNAGTAEPVRVSPPEAVAYLLEVDALRADIDHVHTSFDRSSATQISVIRLSKLRSRRWQRPHVGASLQRLFPPPFESARKLADEKLLASTPAAVDRGEQ